MELVVEPDVYAPSVDDNGNYVDKMPSFNIIKKGLSCLCGTRKDKIYQTNVSFSAHIKSKSHQNWLSGLNSNKTNYFLENQSLIETVKNQRLIIAKLEKDLSNKILTIDYLTQHLNIINSGASEINKKNVVVVKDLLDFN